MPDCAIGNVRGVLNAIMVELPLLGLDGKPLYFYVARRTGNKRFSLLLPTESIGILPINSTLLILQQILRGYGLLLSQEAVILEENIGIALHKRMSTMAQAAIAIDGIRRLWKTEFDKRNSIDGDTLPVSQKPLDQSHPSLESSLDKR